MKRIVFLVMAVAMVSVMFVGCATAGLPQFGAEIGAQANPMGGDSIRVPYQDTVSYYGYVKPGSAPDAEVNGKKMYYVYVWIPLVAPELGMRMVSPVPEGMAPEKTDFVDAAYSAEGKADTTNYFDTWITLDRANEVIMPADIADKAASATWTNYGNNDDSSELPAQPSGSKYNSVLRVVSEPSDPLKALIRGLYRIGFTTYKVGEVQGSFVAQIGAPIKLPGVVVAKTLEEMAKQVKD